MEGKRERKEDEKNSGTAAHPHARGGDERPLTVCSGFSINKRLIAGRHFTSNISARGILHSVKLGKH